MRVDDQAFLIESNRKIREVRVVRLNGNYVIVRLVNTNGVIQVREDRVYRTREAAEKKVAELKSRWRYNPYRQRYESIYYAKSLTLGLEGQYE